VAGHETLIEDIPGLHHAGGAPHLLREIMRTHQVLLNVFSRQVGMPAARLALLRLLVNCRPNELGILDIARRLGINAAAVTRQVKDMEEQRLVARRGDPQDGRRSYVRLTAKGRKAFDEVHKRGHEFERCLAARISEDDVSTATRVHLTGLAHAEGCERLHAGQAHGRHPGDPGAGR
jgi:DNA-binding MarR family transcriptional regulator